MDNEDDISMSSSDTSDTESDNSTDSFQSDNVQDDGESSQGDGEDDFFEDNDFNNGDVRGIDNLNTQDGSNNLANMSLMNGLATMTTGANNYMNNYFGVGSGSGSSGELSGSDDSTSFSDESGSNSVWTDEQRRGGQIALLVLAVIVGCCALLCCLVLCGGAVKGIQRCMRSARRGLDRGLAVLPSPKLPNFARADRSGPTDLIARTQIDAALANHYTVAGTSLQYAPVVMAGTPTRRKNISKTKSKPKLQKPQFVTPHPTVRPIALGQSPVPFELTDLED